MLARVEGDATRISGADVANAGRSKVAPFLKWAGGKRWFCVNYSHLLPAQFNRYIEPFVGSGAVYFHLSPRSALLSDANADLIATYQAIKSQPDLVENLLRGHQDAHCSEHYYRVRERRCDHEYEAAARFIYLNRSCWNGLYRVNLKGKFNVPIGTKSNIILASDNFRLVAEQLESAEIVHEDFEACLDRASSGDFAFVDPPYTVKHDNNGFVKYNERIFSWGDQVRLRDAVVRAVQRGVRCVITNANHSSVRDLYCGIGRMEVVSRPSVIASRSANRGMAEEIVVLC